MTIGHTFRWSALLNSLVVGILLTGCAHAQPRHLSFDFEGGDDGEWSPLVGDWSVSGGVYRQTITTGLTVTTLPYTYQDVSLETAIDIQEVGGEHASAGFCFFGNNDPADQTGFTIAIEADGYVITLKDGLLVNRSQPIPDPTGSHNLYWEIVGPKSLARLDSYPDANGWDCDTRERSGLVQLITYNCSATFDNVFVNNRGPIPAGPPGPEPTPTLPPLSERSFYCPAATTGAGGSLLKFWTAGALEDRISHFDELPDLLLDARRFGSNVVYLVDWWHDGYDNKGDYIIDQELGGEEAFRTGIDAIHDLGGKVVLYLEPFIVHSASATIGLTKGADWAMMDQNGEYYDYYGLEEYYLMYPGEGSGWTEYFSDLCGDLARDYKIDGVYLDSYGIQWGWKDYHPNHPNADTGEGFNQGVVDLIQQTRSKMQAYVPNAMIWLEGSEQELLLQMVDGSQIESLAVYQRKPWWYQRLYQVYIAEYDLRGMQDVLEAGASLACNDFYFADIPSDRDFQKLREGVEHKRGRDMQQRMWKMINVAYANGIDVPEGIDPVMVDCEIEIGQYRVPDGQKLVIPELVQLVDYYEPRLVPLRAEPHKLPSDEIREWLIGSFAEPSPSISVH